MGIFNDNLVYDKIKLYERVNWLLIKFKQPVIVEEYIDGREFTISVLGNNPPRVLPIVEQNFSVFPNDIPHIASYEAKWIFEDNLPNPKDAYFCPAQISSSFKSKIEAICLRIYEILNCKDVCRIDFRVDKNENIYCLEVNTLPGMIPNPDIISYLPVAAHEAGFSFEGLVNTILNEAIKRYNILSNKKTVSKMNNYWPQSFLFAKKNH